MNLKPKLLLLAGLVQKYQPTRLVRVWEKGWGRGHSPEDLEAVLPCSRAGRCLQAGRGKQPELGVPGRQGKEDTAPTSSPQSDISRLPSLALGHPVLSSTEVQYYRVLSTVQSSTVVLLIPKYRPLINHHTVFPQVPKEK